ncbi:MAG TPA: nuclear transport factor 2 family protein [Kribbella sp.]|uniref:nuclear transport factor 2 family protein n=1 Tax=Kribbella sp. TaxID=1871183 RepID=UPI002D774F19|nr:nuclear transport factor 2 family protein [Kribbella sp.]HET6298603.1 nuclear transport factor 2 family protein [Kribbella sp.]
MSETQQVPGTAGFVPTEADLASVVAWFERYDALAAALDYEGMADVAVFPLNEVTDDGKGHGKAEQLGRQAYLEQMAQVMGGGGDVKLETTRTPHFLSDSLVFVISDGTMTYEGHTQPIRYGDLLLKIDGNWHFQTMVQGGWG